MKRNPMRILAGLAGVAAAILGFASCEDEMSKIGNDIIRGEVIIRVDSSEYNLHARSVEASKIDARSTSNLLGQITVPGYGHLECSYVTQMLPSVNLNIPDSISPQDVDSVRMALIVPRSSVTGDSLAPQQLNVFHLTESLPSGIDSNFDPEGKYNPTPIGSKNYTLSALALGDSAFKNLSYLTLLIDLDRQMGVDVLTQYRQDPSVFEWPAEFNKEFKGLYIKPSFGKGCIGNIQNNRIFLYTHHKETKYEKDEEGDSKPYLVDVADSVCFLISAPEVLSSNIIKYVPDDALKQQVAAQDGNGPTIVTSPGGYTVNFRFPAEELLKEFQEGNADLGVISNLKMNIPVASVDNDYGITPPPSLLMVKRGEADRFFLESRIPDSKTSFVCNYSATDGAYQFTNLRPYIIDLLDKKGEITDEDVDFELVPALVTTETITNSDGSTSTVVTGCVPYLERPAMAHLRTDKAMIIFTFSNQTIE